METIRYNVRIALLSVLIAVAMVYVGLLLVAFWREGTGPLLLGGLILGMGSDLRFAGYVGHANARANDLRRPVAPFPC